MQPGGVVEASVEARAPANGQLHLLLVEDSPAEALLVRHMLRESSLWAGAELDTVERVGAAVTRLLRDPAPACTIVDLGLPDADGLEALTAIRAASLDVPVVVLTGRDDEALGLEALRQGAQDYLVKGHVDGHTLGKAIRYAIERMRLEAELRHLALHDQLTGLANRGLFMDRLAVALARCRRNPAAPVAVMVLDLDRFKMVNDSLGHNSGDEMLRAVADRLRAALRPGDTVARLGGDEFGLVCDAGSAREATIIAQRLLDALNEPVVLPGGETFPSASVGIAMAHGDTDAARLLRDADVAMYRAKDSGRGRVELIDEEMVETAERRQSLNTALHRALRRGEFIVLYQPTVDLGTGRIAGAEALVRWAEPRRGLLDAEEFIPTAEESGLIVPIGAWVLTEALRDAATWQRELHGRAPVLVAVNLSARQLLEPDLVDVVAKNLDRARLGGDMVRVGLEITESVIMRDRPLAQRTLAQLKTLGVELAVDDFGMGYGSFAYIRELPIDVLKLDRSVVAGIGTNEQDTTIVESVISMGRSLGLTVIAEGVETQVQLAALRSLGCGYAQGFYFAPPLPTRTMSRMLLRDPRW